MWSQLISKDRKEQYKLVQPFRTFACMLAPDRQKFVDKVAAESMDTYQEQWWESRAIICDKDRATLLALAPGEDASVKHSEMPSISSAGESGVSKAESSLQKKKTALLQQMFAMGSRSELALETEIVE